MSTNNQAIYNKIIKDHNSKIKPKEISNPELIKDERYEMLIREIEESKGIIRRSNDLREERDKDFEKTKKELEDSIMQALVEQFEKSSKFPRVTKEDVALYIERNKIVRNGILEEYAHLFTPSEIIEMAKVYRETSKALQTCPESNTLIRYFIAKGESEYYLRIIECVVARLEMYEPNKSVQKIIGVYPQTK